MSGLTKLRAGIPPVLIANSANPSAEMAPISGNSRISSLSHPEIATLKDRLTLLAEEAGVSAALIDALPAGDLATCSGCSDAVLRGYVRALETTAAIDRGMVPRCWGEPSACVCKGCGPVLLWLDCPSVVKACPWCFRRKAGKRIPRPEVRCGDCRHFVPDEENPAAGVGGCKKSLAAGWPMQSRICAAWEAL